MFLFFFVLFVFVFFLFFFVFFFSSRRRHTRYIGDWSSDVCSSDLPTICLSSSVPTTEVVDSFQSRDGHPLRFE